MICYLKNNTIRDNVRLFNEYNQREVDEAIESAEISKFILEKGEGYKWGEKGNGLSGDEKQRISIARFLLRKTPEKCTEWDRIIK
ncbi:ABC transporter ATP-binding protein/permease [Clostridium amazonitimonense]|uniref:ABC transporter ATP-binding protein/permease n=1 Tax=Clostridium amazonitimonense TaxID=1499689 RepID=UPI000509DA76|nr:ABC transporter ATP-binding protein/permease [Clostridium amazonitimonense]